MAGFVTVGQCEWADYPTKILEKHWPDVPRWRDIRTLTGESFYDRTGLRTVDIISGGFPCQPFSQAGQRRGKDDDRYLWPEMLRVIREIRPCWVVGENVPGIVHLALDEVLSDLENEGYSCQAFVVPACAIDAPHRRDRVAIIANTFNTNSNSSGLQVQGAKQQTTRPTGICQDVAYSGIERLQRVEQQGAFDEGRLRQKSYGPITECGGFRGKLSTWPAEPDVGRVANGVPNRVDRIKCLGNAVVPQQFYPFFYFIANIEQSAGE